MVSDPPRVVPRSPVLAWRRGGHMRRTFVCSFAWIVAMLALGCSSSKHNGPDATPGGADAAMECTADGQTRCLGATFETCMGGAWNVTQQCTESCDSSL